jgi:hypothetical protein
VANAAVIAAVTVGIAVATAEIVAEAAVIVEIAAAEAVAIAGVVAAEAVANPTRQSLYGDAAFSVLKILQISVSLQPLLKEAAPVNYKTLIDRLLNC